MAKFSQKDVDAFGRRYRTMPAQLSQAEVSRQLNVSLSTLRGWISKFGWERDLAPEVKRRTNIAVQKAILGADLDQPLSDENVAITERVAVNVAIITNQQAMLSLFGDSLTIMLDQFKEQVSSNVVAVPDDESSTGFRLVPKKLNDSTEEGRRLIQTMSTYFDEQRKAYGIGDGQGDEINVDEYLRELAEELQGGSGAEADA